MSSQPTKGKRLKCRVCGRTFAAWWTRKLDGARRPGWETLATHFEEEHPAEYAEIQEFAKKRRRAK